MLGLLSTASNKGCVNFSFQFDDLHDFELMSRATGTVT